MDTKLQNRRALAVLRAAKRRKLREEQLGTGTVCVTCLEPDLDKLRYPKASLLHAHHPLGQRHAPEPTLPQCHNCHAKIHFVLADEGVDLTTQPSPIERIREAIHALSLCLGQLGETLRGWVTLFDRLVSWLDSELPDWRKRLEAVCAQKN